MASGVQATFAFEIGDIVTHATAAPSGSILGEEPVKLLVVERHVQQCHGGTQTHYVVRPCRYGDMSTNPLTLASIEVRAYPTAEEFAAARQARHELTERYDEEQRRRTAERAERAERAAQRARDAE